MQKNAYYPVELLDDHKGPLFEHKYALALQLPVYNEHNRLVPPWDMHKQLRPGTLVSIKAKPICWREEGGLGRVSTDIGDLNCCLLAFGSRNTNWLARSFESSARRC